MIEFNNLIDAIIQFENILLSVNEIEENRLWESLFHHFNEEITDEVKSILNFDGRQLLNKIRNYEKRLEYYANNYNFYDDTNSIQENDLKMTTNKYFTEIVSSFREKAIKSLKQLKRMIRETKNKYDKHYLTQTLYGIIKSTNELIDICIVVIQFHKQSLVDNLALKNIDFKEKFNLIHISVEGL